MMINSDAGDNDNGDGNDGSNDVDGGDDAIWNMLAENCGDRLVLCWSLAQVLPLFLTQAWWPSSVPLLMPWLSWLPLWGSTSTLF